jgi:hypothetical protein
MRQNARWVQITMLVIQVSRTKASDLHHLDLYKIKCLPLTTCQQKPTTIAKTTRALTISRNGRLCATSLLAFSRTLFLAVFVLAFRAWRYDHFLPRRLTPYALFSATCCKGCTRARVWLETHVSARLPEPARHEAHLLRNPKPEVSPIPTSTELLMASFSGAPGV